MIAYGELQIKNICQNCTNFLLGPQELKSLKGWWENLGTKLNSHLLLEETDQSSLKPEHGKNCYKTLLARIIGFSSSCFKSTMKNVRDEVSVALKGNADLVSAGPSKELVMSAAKNTNTHNYSRTTQGKVSIGEKKKNSHLNGTQGKAQNLQKGDSDLALAVPSKESVTSVPKQKETHAYPGTQDKVSIGETKKNSHLNGTQDKVQNIQKEDSDLAIAGPSKELLTSFSKQKETHASLGTQDKVSIGEKKENSHLNGTQGKAQNLQKGDSDLALAVPSKESVTSVPKQKETHAYPGTQDKVSIGEKKKNSHLNGTQDKVPNLQKEDSDLALAGPSKEPVTSVSKQKETQAYPGTQDKVSIEEKKKNSHLNGTQDKAQNLQKVDSDLALAGPSKEPVTSVSKHKETHAYPRTQDKMSIGEKKKNTNMNGTQDKAQNLQKGDSELALAGPSKEPVTSASKQKETHAYPRTQDKVGDQRIKLLLNEGQRELLMSDDCRLLFLSGPYGSGKSLLIRLKALELDAQGEKVAFLVGGSIHHAKKFYSLTKQDFENTQINFMERSHNNYYSFSDVVAMHNQGYHIFWDECILKPERGWVKMEIDPKVPVK